MAVALLLSATAVFAEGRPAYAGANGESANHMMASSTATSSVRQELEQRVVQRLLNIKNKVKQQMAEQLAGQFGNLNQTWTDHFSNLLDQYAAILQRIQDRANVAAGTGQDISSTTAAIQAAQTAITNARAAVATQAAKSYTLTASTIPTTATSTPAGQLRILRALRKSFQTLHKDLFRDLFALRDGPMKDVRKAVQDALRTLRSIPGVGGNSATSTPDGQSNQ